MKKILFLLLIIPMLFLAGCQNNNATGACIGEKATLYGATWCGACKKQKEILGDLLQDILYVECADGAGGQTEACKEADIAAYPTWKFADGVERTGALSIKELKEITDCK